MPDIELAEPPAAAAPLAPARGPIWLRNLLLAVVCLGGTAVLAGNLLQANRVGSWEEVRQALQVTPGGAGIAPREAHAARGLAPSSAAGGGEGAGRANQPREADATREAAGGPVAAGSPVREAPAESVIDVVRQLDAEFSAAWEEAALPVAPRADTLQIARRLALGLAGTVPSFEEIQTLERLTTDQAVSWYLERLLQDRRAHDYLAERFARAYVGTEQGPFLLFRRRRFVTWLSDRIAENLPYDQLARQLITGDGLWTSNPAVNFHTVTITEDQEGRPDPVRLAARTSRAFLGMRIDCLQCHDDQLGNVQLGTAAEPRDGTQRDFHQLAAFFAQTRISLLGLRDRPGERYQYQYLDQSEAQEVPAEVPFLPQLDKSPPAADARKRLADWLVHPQNRPFGRAVVNRVWALLFSRPLLDPIDDIPLFGDYPPGMELLVDDLTAHGYDLQRLIRIIASSRVFQLSSRAPFEILPEHETQWCVFPLTRLRPEQVAGTILQASALKTIDANTHILFQLQRALQERDFVERYGDIGEDEFEARAGTIPQRLLMMNGQLVKERTEPNPLLNASTRIAGLAPGDAEAVEAAYLCALCRPPSQRERDHFVKRLQGTRGADRSRAMEDLFWVLLNSTECLWNH